ncbi:MAG: DNA translocase FtsK [Butyricicoccus sp.]|nr:DNA translocase FtsK [Butyricicoccus sp.]
MMAALRITPAAIIEAFRRPEYEYDDDEERERYEQPRTLPNVHEVAAEHRIKKAEKAERKAAAKSMKAFDLPIDGAPAAPAAEAPVESGRFAAFDLTLDETPVISHPEDADKPASKKDRARPISPDEYLKNLNKVEEVRTAVEEEPPIAPPEDPFGDILNLISQRDARRAAGEPGFEAAPFQRNFADDSAGFDLPLDIDKNEQVVYADVKPAAADEDTPPWDDDDTGTPTKKKAKGLSEAEQAKMSAVMDKNQQAALPPYSYPPLYLLSQSKGSAKGDVQAELQENSTRLIDTLESFGVSAKIIGIVRGPSVTRFELTISRGIKFSRITALADDIALALGAVSVRIAPIPDKVAIGIEVPNKIVNMVPIRDVLGSNEFARASSRVAFAVGKDITGSPVVSDIGKMPHLLIAGTTGSGKSVCVNSMLISLLYKSTPEEVRIIMIDPKMVELGNYNGIPHLLIPVVTDPRKAAGALNWAVGEMERRYMLFADNQVRNLTGYNDLMRKKKAEAEVTEGGNPSQFQVLPQVVIVIDELADLMMVAAKEVETSICRIAQKARAAGMHLIVATQRPSADVITGIMKANIPSRIAFAVASQIESRIILDQTGAEKLIGKGDMLYAPLGEGKPRRVQGCFISNEEIEAVIAHIKQNAVAEYSEEILVHIEKQAEKAASGDKNSSGSSGGDPANDEDEMLFDAIDVVVRSGQASTSMLQRHLKLGYSRAARIIDQMEERGIIGPFEGSKPRRLLISKEDWQEMKLRRDSI